jgi:hypothetical protein
MGLMQFAPVPEKYRVDGCEGPFLLSYRSSDIAIPVDMAGEAFYHHRV